MRSFRIREILEPHDFFRIRGPNGSFVALRKDTRLTRYSAKLMVDSITSAWKHSQQDAGTSLVFEHGSYGFLDFGVSYGVAPIENRFWLEWFLFATVWIDRVPGEGLFNQFF